MFSKLMFERNVGRAMGRGVFSALENLWTTTNYVSVFVHVEHMGLINYYFSVHVHDGGDCVYCWIWYRKTHTKKKHVNLSIKNNFQLIKKKGDITPHSWQGRLIIVIIIAIALYVIPTEVSAMAEAFSLERGFMFFLCLVHSMVYLNFFFFGET